MLKTSNSARRFASFSPSPGRLVIYCALLVFLTCSPACFGADTAQSTGNVLERMLATKNLVVGYAGYPPYLKRDPNTGAISGYSVDILTAILQPLGVAIQWRETTWDNMKQDLLSGKFDLMVEPIFVTKAYPLASS